jgi:hypothetical protein
MKKLKCVFSYCSSPKMQKKKGKGKMPVIPPNFQINMSTPPVAVFKNQLKEILISLPPDVNREGWVDEPISEQIRISCEILGIGLHERIFGTALSQKINNFLSIIPLEYIENEPDLSAILVEQEMLLLLSRFSPIEFSINPLERVYAYPVVQIIKVSVVNGIGSLPFVNYFPISKVSVKTTSPFRLALLGLKDATPTTPTFGSLDVANITLGKEQCDRVIRTPLAEESKNIMKHTNLPKSSFFFLNVPLDLVLSDGSSGEVDLELEYLNLVRETWDGTQVLREIVYKS